MEHSSTTYRSLSVFTLTLLLSIIVVPSTISAASLFCNMEHAALHGPAEACCDHMQVDGATDLAIINIGDDCSSQMLCEQTVADSQDQIQAVQQVTKEIVIVSLSEESHSFLAEEQHHFSHFDLPVIKESPPIFLLNSTFLN